MSIFIPTSVLWAIPVVITVLCLAAFFWPSQNKEFHGRFWIPDVESMFKVLYLIPIGIVWAITFAIAYFMKG